MKWVRTENGVKASIAKGLIEVIIKWDLFYNRGYILVINTKCFPAFDDINNAKKTAEAYIKDALNLAAVEV